MRIAITGSPGSGKTTLLKRLVNRLGSFKGFYTEEIREGSHRVGFLVVPLEGEPFILASIRREDLKDPRYRVGRYLVDREALERIVEILEKSIGYGKIAIDEVGKMELLHPRFWPLVQEALEREDVILTYGKNIPREMRKYIEYKAHVVELNKRGDAEKRLPILLSRLR